MDVHRAASLFAQYHLNYYTDDPARLIADPAVDLVYIASNHASHAEYAIQALERGKSVHIEKPHAVTEDQLLRLCRAMHSSSGRVRLGFNRPYSPFGQAIRAALGSQSGPAMLNWFIAGHELPKDHWYFKDEEGGRVLGNLCHWTDFIYQLVPAENRLPVVITPTRSRQADCDIAVTYRFGDDTLAVITFSAKGHTFEGVRERFAAHRGNVLISMDDFQELLVENVDRKTRKRSGTATTATRRTFAAAMRWCSGVKRDRTRRVSLMSGKRGSSSCRPRQPWSPIGRWSCRRTIPLCCGSSLRPLCRRPDEPPSASSIATLSRPEPGVLVCCKSSKTFAEGV